MSAGHTFQQILDRLDRLEANVQMLIRTLASLEERHQSDQRTAGGITVAFNRGGAGSDPDDDGANATLPTVSEPSTARNPYGRSEPN
jgi:hypothetical protein